MGEYKNSEFVTREIYRFDNGISQMDQTLCWDLEYLTKSVIEGLKKCGELGIVPDTVAIDTWGVDYVLLDKDLNEILPAVSYRDSRTIGIPEEVDSIISMDALYAKTGIQRQNYNTIYQLYCDAKSGKLDLAEHLLFMPEYLSYKLTGVLKSEYTIASTSSLVNAKTKNWDFDLIRKLGIKETIFKPIAEPCCAIGGLSEDVKTYVGFDTTVVFVGSHDTASAVAACSLTGHGMYISSGTWSLIGALNRYPVLSKEAQEMNFTNEGGVGGTYRFLKNIMGMWLFQNIRKNIDKKYTYDEMMYMAMESDFTDVFDPNDQRLVAPDNMIDAIKECLGKPDLPLGDLLSSVYHSLATSYAKVVKEIELVTGEAVDCIQIVGGGSKDVYLNRLTQEFTGKPVLTGPIEATAIGNLKAQMIYWDSCK